MEKTVTKACHELKQERNVNLVRSEQGSNLTQMEIDWDRRFCSAWKLNGGTRATSIALNSCKGTNLSISLIQQNKSNVWLGFKCWPSNGESI